MGDGTAEELTARGAHPPSAGGPPSEATSWQRLGWVPIAAVVALPLLAMIVALAGEHWVPVGDDAVILHRTQQVGTSEHPMVGPYSTRGWAHPGPALYHLLAPLWWVLGGAPVDSLRAAALVNLVAAVGVCHLAHRRRGPLGAAWAAAVLATLFIGLRSELLVQVWNPYVALLLYLALLLATWGLLERDLRLTPWWVLLASSVVQMHVAYIPLVGGLVAVLGGVGIWWLRRRGVRRALDRFRHRVPWRSSVLVAGVVWAPVAWDAVWGSGNVRSLVRYFVGSDGTATGIGVGDGWGILADHLRPTGPWSGGREDVVFGSVQPGSLWPLLVVLGLHLALVAAAVARMGLDRVRVPAISLVAMSQIVVGGLAAGRVEAPVLSYLIVWMLPLAAFTWGAVLVGGWDLVVAHRGLGSLSGRVASRRDAGAVPETGVAGRVRTWAGIATVGSMVIVGVQLVRVWPQAIDPPLPRAGFADAVSAMVDDMHGQLPVGPPVRIEGVGDDFHEAWVGVVHGLHREGVEFVTSDGAGGQKWGRAHIWDGQPVTTVLTLATSLPTSFDDPVEVCRADPAVRELARWDQLSDQERQRLKALQIQNYEARGDLDATVAAELEDLGARSWRLVAFEGGRPCGG